jgi:cytochrome c
MLKSAASLAIIVAMAVITGTATGSARADGDAALGEKAFKKCKACHKLEQGKKGIGPSLYGVVGRPVATLEGYKYSKAMIAFGDGKIWTEELLDTYLTKPKALVPRTKMTFPGFKKEADRANVIAYLNTVQ